MYDLENASLEQLLAIAKAALKLSTALADTEQLIDGVQSSFKIEDEWSELTAALSVTIK